MLKLRSRTWRIILASFVGSLFALAVLIDLRSFLLSVAIRIISTLTIVMIAFAFHSFKELCKHSLLTLCVSFVFSGVMIAVYQLFRPPNMQIVNDIVYFDVDPLLLLVLTGVIYCIMYWIERLFRERVKATVVRLEFTVCGLSVSCMGKLDTGCSLTEPFSGAPVIIADSSVLTVPEVPERRVIPYSTVGGSSVLFGIRAQSVTINGKPVEKEIYIAQGEVHSSSYQAILNSDIVR